MSTWLTYGLVVLIWGSTFAAIPYQLGSVPIELSVAYRFAIAAAALLVYALATRRSLRIPLSLMPTVLLQGLFLFSLNYLLVYRASAHLTTGLIAVLFTTIIVSNALLERLLFKARFDQSFYLAALLGIGGITLVFLPEVSRLSLTDATIIGVLLTLGSVLSASFGNMTATYNMQKDVPVVALNIVAMGLATLMSLGMSLSMGQQLTFSFEPGYLLSLLYLSVLGTAVAFGCYLALIRQIGPSRAAYCTVLFPIVALGLSTVLENYVWTATAAFGILLSLLGNWLMLRIRQ